MEGIKLATALTISIMALTVIASFGMTAAQDVGAPAPAPALQSGTSTLYVPAILAAMASIFACLF